MDEQMMQPAEATNPDPLSEPIEDYDAPPMPNGEPSEVALDDDGDVKFSEDFFDAPENKPELEKPGYYTTEELRNTPYEQWQFERLPEELREYAQIVSQQIESRRAQQQISQRQTNPPLFEAPKSYTPKEIAEEAQKIAVQKLGLQDADDFDDYEPEHRAALNMAMNELVQQNQNARQNYERIKHEYQNLQQFNAQLASRADYRDFNRWFDEKLKSMNVAPQVIDEYLTNFARQSGGNYAAIQSTIAGWYNEFLQEKGYSRAPKPPMMESTRGQPFEMVRGVNMRDFGEMSPDAQAAALMRMGYV